MKILKWIDQCVDSFEKRIFLFIVFITLYWLWQNIWQLFLFFKLYFITDYSSLFQLQAKLQAYESSALIRILYCVISNPSFDFIRVVSCIKPIDIFGVFGLICMFKKCRKIGFLMAIKYIWCIFWIGNGMHAKSVYLLINSLKWLSFGGFILVFLCMILWLYQCISIIYQRDKIVHDL